MGISTTSLKFLLNEKKRLPFQGSVITLGRQDIYFDFQTLQKIANDFAVPLTTPQLIDLSPKSHLRINKWIADDTLFSALGFSQTHSLDYSDFEKATICFDLNQPDMPSSLEEKFDVIIDGGTLEHVFHLPNVFKNLFKMLRPDGRIIHFSPSSNSVDHGFYCFSPTFFWDYYSANHFQINTIQIFRCTHRHDQDPTEVFDYQPGCLQSVSQGGLDDRIYYTFCVVTKTQNSCYHVIPQQGAYLNDQWKEKKERPKNNPASISTSPPILLPPSHQGGKMGVFKNLLSCVPPLFYFSRGIFRFGLKVKSTWKKIKTNRYESKLAKTKKNQAQSKIPWPLKAVAKY